MKHSVSLHVSECEICPHRADADLCILEGSAAVEFEKIRRTVDYQPGQFVFYEGHAALGLYVLCAGRVKLTRSTKRGQRRVVGIVDPGQLIEKHAFKEKALHQVTCEALESSKICMLDRERYLSLLEQNGELAVRLVKLLSHEMSLSFDETDQFAFASARERIASLLLELADRYGEQTAEGLRISLLLKREELAQMAALTVETAVRILSSLQSAQLIRIKGREITILQPERLAQAARQSSSLHLVP